MADSVLAHFPDFLKDDEMADEVSVLSSADHAIPTAASQQVGYDGTVRSDINDKKDAKDCGVTELEDVDSSQPKSLGEDHTDSNVIITTKPHESLSPSQKAYLVEKLTRLQEFKYAKSFLSLPSTVSMETSIGSGAMDLNTMLDKVLNDKYASAQAFDNDIQLVVNTPASIGGSRRGDANNRKTLLRNVENFMKTLPESTPPETVSTPKKSQHDTAGEIELPKKVSQRKSDKVLADATKLIVGPSKAQQGETECALEQVATYQNGKQSDKSKNFKNLIVEKDEELAAKEKKRQEQLAGAKRRLERSTLVCQQNNMKSGGNVESRLDKEKEEIEVNGDPVEENMDEPKGEEVNNYPVEDNVEDVGTGGVNEDHVREELHISAGNDCPDDKKRKALDSSLEDKNGSKRRKTSDFRKETWAEKEKRLDREYVSQREQERAEFITPAEKKQPVDQLWQSINKHAAENNKIHVKGLKELCDKGPISQDQIEALLESRKRGFKVLLRTASRTPGFAFDTHKEASNGRTTGRVMLPAADCNRDQFIHEYMTDIPQGGATYMIGTHLIWQDMRSDEFLSVSISFNFVLIHALNRANEGQGRVTVQALEREKARDARGDPAAFYAAPDLCDIFKIQEASVWSKPARIALNPRKFTQELLSHGPVKLDDTVLKPAPLQDLIKDGLFKAYPVLEIPEGHRRTGLHHGQVEVLKVGYRPRQISNGPRRVPKLYSYDAIPVPLTTERLELMRKITMNFMIIPEGADETAMQPLLHIFLLFLTLEKRERSDPTLMEWIKTRYTASDVTEIYTNSDGSVRPGFTSVANNLPDVMQFLDLVRDCISLFSLPVQLPANNIIDRHPMHNRDRDFRYAELDFKHNKKDEKSKPYDADAQTDRRDRARAKRQAAVEALTIKSGKGAANDKSPMSGTTGLSIDSTGQAVLDHGNGNDNHNDEDYASDESKGEGSDEEEDDGAVLNFNAAEHRGVDDLQDV